MECGAGVWASNHYFVEPQLLVRMSKFYFQTPSSHVYLNWCLVASKFCRFEFQLVCKAVSVWSWCSWRLSAVGHWVSMGRALKRFRKYMADTINYWPYNNAKLNKTIFWTYCPVEVLRQPWWWWWWAVVCSRRKGVSLFYPMMMRRAGSGPGFTMSSSGAEKLIAARPVMKPKKTHVQPVQISDHVALTAHRLPEVLWVCFF